MADETNAQDNGETGSEELSVEDRLAALEAENEALKKAARNNQRLLREKRALVEKVKEWHDLPSPDEVRQMLAEREQGASENGDLEKVLKLKEETWAKKIATMEAKLADREKMVQQLMIDDRLRAALQEANVKPTAASLLLEHFRAQAKLIEDPDATYGMRAVIETSGDLVDMDEYVKEWAKGEQAADFVVPPRNAGGTARPGTGRAPKVAPAKMTPKEKAAYIAEHGLDAWRQLVASSSKAAGNSAISGNTFTQA